MRFVAIGLLWTCSILLGCSQSTVTADKADSQNSSYQKVTSPKAVTQSDRYSHPCLVDVTRSVGINFQHVVGALDGFSMPQIMGSGGALFDFDNDNDLDVLLIQGASSDSTSGNASSSPTSSNPAGLKLFRQDSPTQFTDVTSTSGIRGNGFGMGCAVADVNNDGYVDLYITRYGDDSLYLNQGNGQFIDATTSARISNPQWGTAASFFDYDRDGWLDLFVVNYVDFFPGSICEDGAGRRDFCGPESLAGTTCKLYHNITGSASANNTSTSNTSADNKPDSQSPSRGGEGPKFEDVTVASGIARRVGKGLGVICRDFDMDGRQDILVANDGMENFLWIQHDNSVFSNEALLRGVALNRIGEAEANMGIVADDFNRDGFSDLFITHLREESDTLFRGAQFGQFSDQTVASGFAVTSLPFTSFGVAAIDFDHDADLDLAICNGGVKRGLKTDSKDVEDFWRDYAQRNEVYLNNGRGDFVSEEKLGGSDFARRIEVSRALLSGDVDNDGDVDLLVTNCAGPARLYHNEFPKQGNWLTITARDPALNRVALGAQIQMVAGKLVINRELNPSTGYLGSNDPRVHFGLGKAPRYDAIRVYWPSGSGEIEEFPGGQLNQQITLVRGTGRVLAGASP